MANAGPSTPRRKDPLRHHHGELRDALVDAAWNLVEEEGVERLTLRRVARRVGVTPMAPYHHFADKASLVSAVARRGFEALREAMSAAVAAEPSLLLKLRAMGVAYVVFAVQHPATFRLMFGAELANASAHPALAEAAARTMELLVAGFRETAASGAIADVNPRDAALTSWAALHGTATLLLAGQIGPVTEENAVERALLVTRGLRDGLRSLRARSDAPRG